MSVNTTLRHQSLSLYLFMCQNIVGTEETVRIKRMMIMVHDNLTSNEMASITSGSFGEGLEMKGSDLDTMFVSKLHIVHENTGNVEFNHDQVNFVMEMKDTKPGFTLLRCCNPDKVDKAICMEKCSSSESLYLSSQLFKTYWLKALDKTVVSKIHGPCLSDEDDYFDYAFSFHNPKWIQPAENWIRRGNIAWPSSDVRSDIIDHGVLLVPIGCKGSVNEALEWRISFSVAEKLLVYSFCHSQLICYALMKILLKDCINSNANCKDLLCSYFIKTIIFWVSEETAVNEWKPENVIRCFMSCFRRLVYNVEYSVCPHYFIPTINLFENKIEEQYRELLLGHLRSLFSFGWHCVLFSEQFQNFKISSNLLLICTEMKKTQLQYLLTSQIATADFLSTNQDNLKSYRKCIKQLNLIKSSTLKSMHLRFMSFSCSQDLMQSNTASPSHANKNTYYLYRKKQSYLLQSVNHDAGSGWLMLAAFFYGLKQYSKALYLLNYTLMKCTPEKTYYGKCLSEKINLNTPTTLNKLRLLRSLKCRVILPVKFASTSTIVPEEIALIVSQTGGCEIPPIVFTHFLCFLCHHNLNDREMCYNSISNLQQTIDENVFIAHQVDKIFGYGLLGIALHLVGQYDLAAKSFSNAYSA